MSNYSDRTEHLLTKLRCLTCLHQSVADSDSLFAEKIKRHVVRAIRASKTDEDILEELTRVHGPQVLWRPPHKGFHQTLWYMPFCFLLLACIRAWRRLV